MHQNEELTSTNHLAHVKDLWQIKKKIICVTTVRLGVTLFCTRRQISKYNPRGEGIYLEGLIFGILR